MLRHLLDDQGQEAREMLVNQKDKHGITPVFLILQRWGQWQIPMSIVPLSIEKLMHSGPRRERQPWSMLSLAEGKSTNQSMQKCTREQKLPVLRQGQAKLSHQGWTKLAEPTKSNYHQLLKSNLIQQKSCLSKARNRPSNIIVSFFLHITYQTN